MKDMPTLILKSERDDFEKFYSQHMRKKDVDVRSVYKREKGIAWYLMIFWIQIFRLPFQSIWYGNWKKNIKSYKTIIIFDRVLNYEIIPYIKRRNPKCRIIFWFWNIVKRPLPEQYLSICEGWSFDEGDCKKFKLKRNIQFYFNLNICQDNNEIIDVFFVGKDKGRSDLINNIYTFLNDQKFYAKFFVVDKHKRGGVYTTTFISYTEIIKIIQRSKAILEIVQKGQHGLTVRSLEALFFNKKLITNNSNIVKETFYKDYENNIFIFDKHIDYVQLAEFLRKPYQPVPDDIKHLYMYEKWIDNFNM